MHVGQKTIVERKSKLIPGRTDKYHLMHIELRTGEEVYLMLSNSEYEDLATISVPVDLKAGHTCKIKYNRDKNFGVLFRLEDEFVTDAMREDKDAYWRMSYKLLCHAIDRACKYSGLIPKKGWFEDLLD